MSPVHPFVRLGLALFIVLPLTLLLVAATAGTAADGPLIKRFVNAALFFAFLGPVLTVLFTLTHTGLEYLLPWRGRPVSIALSVLVGCLTVLPLVLERDRFEGVLFGAVGGLVYGILLSLIKGGDRSSPT